MATLNEMKAVLKCNHPEMCVTQDIDNLPMDSPSPAGGQSVTKLYIEYGYHADNWESFTQSEKRLFLKAYTRVTNLAKQRGYLIEDGFNVINLVSNGWANFKIKSVFIGKDSIRIGISSGGVVQINGSPFSPKGDILTNVKAISDKLDSLK